MYLSEANGLPGQLRVEQLRRFDAVVSRMRDGVGIAVAVTGDPGIGKSRLLAAVRAHAHRSGLTVRVYDPRAVTGAAGEAQAIGGRSDLVVVDDAHLLDPEHSGLVAELIDLTSRRPVIFLVALRERQVPGRLAAVLTEALAVGRLDQWRLGPLSIDQARALIGNRPDLAEIHHVAKGNPLYLKLLADDREVFTGEAHLALAAELSVLSPRQRRVAEAAAVLGGPVTAELLAPIAELSTAETLLALDQLTGVDLMRLVAPVSYTYRHAVLAQVVYHRIRPSSRHAMHRRATAILAGRPAGRSEARLLLLDGLTGRERDIATLVSRGLTSAQIGAHLHLSVRTVDNCLGRVYRKLQLPNRIALARLVVEGGLA